MFIQFEFAQSFLRKLVTVLGSILYILFIVYH